MLSPTGGILELLTCFILYISKQTLQFCNLVMYIIFCCFDVVAPFIFIGVQIQNGTFFVNADSLTYGLTGYAIACFLFYIIAITVAFRAYREFKALSLEGAIQAPGAGMMGGGNGGGYYVRQPPPDDDVEQQRGNQGNQPARGGAGGGFAAFSGQGVTIG
eukprot:TRINITY_DN1780_c0_g1_i1.p1 TRINITY_DN1780_c0_g1~~TRINITY_DN1780_c0_g1_i1.p1  ORF type:complete len:160 (-),score=21.68 TRINITY_DN1780_c0_g1_i1:58-537(-)